MILGARYYKDLKSAYSSDGNPMQLLRPTDPQQKINTTLMEAMVALRTCNAKKGPMMEWLLSGPAPNQREAVGIFKACLLVRPSASMQQRQLVEETMSYVVRHKLQDVFPYEVSLMKHHFDICLQACWAIFQKTGHDPAAFWDRYGGIAQLVMDSSDTQNILQEKLAWTNVRDQIVRAIGRSGIERKLWGFAYRLMLSKDVGQLLHTGLQALKQPMLNLELVSTTKSKIMNDIQALQNLDMLPPKRKVSIFYRSVELQFDVPSNHFHLEIQAAAFIKGAAVDLELLEPLSFEAQLVPKSHAKGVVEVVDKELIAKTKLARARCNTMLEGVRSFGIEALKAELAKNMEAYLTLDPHFTIEQAFLEQMSGEVGMLRLVEEIGPFCLTAHARARSPWIQPLLA